MLRWAILLVWITVAACSQASSQQVAVSTQSPSHAASTVVSPSPVATPTLGHSAPSRSDLPVVRVGFSCRLPAVTSSGGGFLSFPDATFAADPTGGFSQTVQGGLVTNASPKLQSSPLNGGVFFDAVEQRWLPASDSQVSPDGSTYAYATFDPSNGDAGHVHIVDIATGADRIFAAPAPRAPFQGFNVADFTAAGIYLVANQVDRLQTGAWLMDPATGTVKALAQVVNVLRIRNGYAWTLRVDPRDPSPPQPGKGTPGDSLVRVDLTSGVETIWFYRPAEQVELRGLDSQGGVVVASFQPTTGIPIETRLVENAGSAGVLIYSGALGLGAAEGTRLWLEGTTGIYLFSVDQGLQKVFEFTSTGGQISPVGPCL